MSSMQEKDLIEDSNAKSLVFIMTWVNLLTIIKI